VFPCGGAVSALLCAWLECLLCSLVGSVGVFGFSAGGAFSGGEWGSPVLVVECAWSVVVVHGVLVAGTAVGASPAAVVVGDGLVDFFAAAGVAADVVSACVVGVLAGAVFGSAVLGGWCPWCRAFDLGDRGVVFGLLRCCFLRVVRVVSLAGGDGERCVACWVE